MLIKSEEFLFSVGWIRYSFVGKEPFAIIKETQPLIKHKVQFSRAAQQTQM